MELGSDMINVITNGSIAVVVFVMWYLSLKQFSKQHDQQHRQIQENIERLFVVIEQDIKYKELLTGLLSRLETKIDCHMKDITSIINT